MKRISKIASLLVLSSFLLFSCGEAEVIHEDILDPADIVLVTKEKTMAVGEKYQIQATYVNEKSEEEPATLLYKSLDTSIATVSSSGLVEAVGVGETIIQITYSKSKSLFKVIVEGNQDSSLLGLSIFDNSLLLYEGDEFIFKYESRLNGKLIDLNATYYDYDASIISIDNNVITALNAGETTAKIKVTYGELVAEESFSVTVQAVRYNLFCNYENSQVVAGEEDLFITYSLCHGSSLLKTLSLSEMECSVSDTSIASINGDVITGIKKGGFTISASYFVSDIRLTSVDSFRCRERYTVKLVDLDKSISLLDGEYIDYVPDNDDKKLVFDTWLNSDGAEFNEPVECNLNLFTRWRINEFEFAQDTRDAKSIAPTVGEEGETIEATPYNDYDVFSNGLKYTLSKNSSADSHDAQLDGTMAHIYLPKMDYRQCNKVTYRWKTSGWVAVNSYPDHWYDGALTLGGTIVVSYDGNVLTQTITQTDVSYPNDKITSICSDVDVIQGNKPLESLGYWTFESLTFTNYLYLSYPKITYVNCVDHHYINTPRIDKIGYYDLICCLCGKDGGLSEETMTLADVNFINNQYGAHGGRWGDFPITDTDAFRTERTLKYEISVANAEDQIFIPKINFKAFRKVQFEISCSSSSIGAGLESGSYILPADGSIRSTGVMSFEVSGNSLVVSLTCNETGLSQQKIISDNDIINGNSPFGFFMYSTLVWQTVTIKPVLLAGTGPHNFVNTIPTDKIGNYETICELCGEKGGYSEEAMNYSDVNFIDNQYGAHGGVWGDIFPVTETDAFKTEKTLKYEVTAANTEDEIFLPRINFTAFTNVQFSVTCGSFAIAAGIQSGSYVLPNSSIPSDPAHTGTLSFKYKNNQLEATLTCNETLATQTVIINDADIINGDAPLSLFMISGYLWQTVTIGLTVLSGPCTHNFVNVVSKDVIGHYDTVCSLCGESGGFSEEIMTIDDVDFTESTYGAYGGKWGTNVQPTEKTMTYEVVNGKTESEIFLPKINFSLYKSVSFSVYGNVWDARVGLESGSYAFPYNASSVHSGTLSFVVSTNQVAVSLECAEGTNQNLVITDPDIINGVKSFSLFMIADDAYRTIGIQLLSIN